MNISEPFIKRPVATSLLMVGVLLVGLLGYYLLPISALPPVSVVVTSTGEKPSATSILLQGKTPAITGGIQFGMGVRCMSQNLLRLFVHNASSGVVTAPTATDNTTVPARSAELGDLILSGQTRLYLFYYRDPTLLGACSAQSSNTFNCTQGQSVVWVH